MSTTDNVTSIDAAASRNPPVPGEAHTGIDVDVARQTLHTDAHVRELHERAALQQAAIADRLEEERRRIYQAVGSVQTVMKIIDDLDDASVDSELSPLWAALSLAVETLEDVADKLEAPVILKPHSAEALTAVA